MALGFFLGAATVFLAIKFLEKKQPAPVVNIPITKEPEAPIPPAPEPEKEEPVIAPPVTAVPPAPEVVTPVKPLVPKPRVAIVIDDMGQDINKLRELLELNAPISIAVMPGMRYSKETANEAHSKGLEVIVHLPMEPKDANGNDPGTDALLTSMSGEEVRKRTEEGLKSVPFASGLNNHMGSKFTEDEAGMKAVIGVLKKKGMIFLDSRTSSDSVGGRLARETGVKNADRNVFLDNNKDVKYIKGQIEELVSIAKKRGKAIAIGHPYPETIEALRQSVPELEKNGIEVVKLSDLVE